MSHQQKKRVLSVLFQTDLAGGETVWWDLHCLGLRRGERDHGAEGGQERGHDDGLPQLPYHQPRPPSGGHGGVQVWWYQHHFPQTCGSVQKQCTGITLFWGYLAILSVLVK